MQVSDHTMTTYGIMASIFRFVSFSSLAGSLFSFIPAPACTHTSPPCSYTPRRVNAKSPSRPPSEALTLTQPAEPA